MFSLRILKTGSICIILGYSSFNMVILRAKCIIAGDAAVGKSALVQTFCSDGSQYPKNYSMTVGVDLHTKVVNIPETSDSVEFYLYDSAGKEVFVELVEQSHNRLSDSPRSKSLLLTCFGDFLVPLMHAMADLNKAKERRHLIQAKWDILNMIMIVYDATNVQSFNACVKWIERCLKKGTTNSIIGVLVANKIDLKQRRVVTIKQGKELASSHGLEYFETSAKQSENVEATFYYLASSYHKLYQDKLEMMQSLV